MRSNHTKDRLSITAGGFLLTGWELGVQWVVTRVAGHFVASEYAQRIGHEFGDFVLELRRFRRCEDLRFRGVLCFTEKQ